MFSEKEIDSNGRKNGALNEAKRRISAVKKGKELAYKTEEI